jgi:hypothetical protein
MRKLLVALAGLAVVVAAVVVVLWPRPASRITRENFWRIKKGMTWAEVTAILGPPGFYTTGDTQLDPTVPPDLADRFGSDNGAKPPDMWQSDTAWVFVWRDESDLVVKGTCEPRRPATSIARQWERMWHRWFPE